MIDFMRSNILNKISPKTSSLQATKKHPSNIRLISDDPMIREPFLAEKA